ncbi:MAG: hypothetical protein HXY23_12395 [Parvularculaceae bacterium]|nr:hypothetical protein [Parvularculaceae bacterium]
MPNFGEALEAWSLYAAALERKLGTDVGASVVLPFQTWMSLDWHQADALVAAYSKQTFVDIMPQLNPDPARYVESSARVSVGFESFVRGLNGQVLNAVPAADRRKLMALYAEWQKKQQELGAFEDKVLEAWKTYVHGADPTQRETRADWERRYRYDSEREMLRRRVDEIAGAYLAEASANPDLIRLANASAALSAEQSRLPLPAEPWQVPYRDTWESRLRCGVLGDISSFVAQTGEHRVYASVSTGTSRVFEKRWSARAKGRYGFFRASANASGGQFEQNIARSIESVDFSFANVSTFTVVRGLWYDGSLIRDYGAKVDFEQFWGERGTLNAIPVSVILAHSPSVVVKLDKYQRDEYKKWRQVSGGAGFGWGPWSIGGGASFSSRLETVKEEDVEGGIKIIGAEKQLFAIGMLVEIPGVWFERSAEEAGVNPRDMAAMSSLNSQKVEAGRVILRGLEADFATSAATLDRLLGVRS